MSVLYLTDVFGMDLILASACVCAPCCCPGSWDSLQSYILIGTPLSGMQWVRIRSQVHWLQQVHPPGWHGGPQSTDSLSSHQAALWDWMEGCLPSIFNFAMIILVLYFHLYFHHYFMLTFICEYSMSRNRKNGWKIYYNMKNMTSLFIWWITKSHM